MTPTHKAKVSLNEQFARVAKALASPRRLELLDLLAQGSRNVEALARESEMSVALASAHLQALRRAGLVIGEPKGQRVVYRLASDDVYELLTSVRDVARGHLADVERAATAYLGAADHVDPISREELWARMREGTAVVLDLRPRAEYEAGHLPGALSTPLEELADRLSELPGDRQIAAYCRGPYCALAPNGLAVLKEAGFHARPMVDGFPEWRLAGYPVEIEPGA